MTNQELIEIAIKARENAICDLTNYAVGAALLTETGKVYTGVNIEHSISGLGICAERAAFVNALSNGEKKFVKIVAVGGKSNDYIDKPVVPCGACLQYMLDFAEEITILSYEKDIVIEKKIGDLLKNIYKYKRR